MKLRTTLIAPLALLAALPALSAWPEKPMRIVDNKPGAGGAEVVRSAPDGSTLMLSDSAPLAIGPFTLGKQPHDPVQQFTHVAMLGFAVVTRNGTEFAGFVAKQINDWSPAIKAADLK